MDNFYEYVDKCFSLEGSDDWAYCTVCFGFATNGETMNALVADEVNEYIWIENIDISSVDRAQGEVNPIYTHPKHDLVLRVFVYDWREGAQIWS